MRRAARLDSNQALIVGALLSSGCVVQSMATVGDGCPDLLVAHNSPTRGKTWVVMEVKDGRKPPSARKLTPDQVEWHARFAGWPVFIVENVEQALAALVAK